METKYLQSTWAFINLIGEAVVKSHDTDAH